MNSKYIIVPNVKSSSTQELKRDSSDIEIIEEIRKQNANKYSEEILPRPITTVIIRPWEAKGHSEDEFIIPDLINPLMVKKTNNNNNNIYIKAELTNEVTLKNIEKEITQTIQKQPFCVDTNMRIVNTVQKYTVSNGIKRVNGNKRSILHPIRNSNMNVKEISVNQFPNQEPKTFLMGSTIDLTKDSEESYRPPDKKILTVKPKVQNLVSTNKINNITIFPKLMTSQYICTNSFLVMSNEDIKKDIIGYCTSCALSQDMAHYLCKNCNLNLQYKCLKCEQLFYSWTKIMNHINLKRTVPKKVYKCKYCSLTSFNNSNVKKHIALAHKELVLS